MRPDLTISLWSADLDPVEAEKKELMVHVHFDAKYRIYTLQEAFKDDEIEDEKPEPTETGAFVEDVVRTYKHIDLKTMHAYRDAIRRTQGAYIIYPGNENRTWFGFHEVLPGLGAFSLSPGKDEDVGTRPLTVTWSPEIDPPPMVRFWQLKGVGHEQETVQSGADHRHAPGGGGAPQSRGSGR